MNFSMSTRAQHQPLVAELLLAGRHGKVVRAVDQVRGAEAREAVAIAHAQQRDGGKGGTRGFTADGEHIGAEFGLGVFRQPQGGRFAVVRRQPGRGSRAPGGIRRSRRRGPSFRSHARASGPASRPRRAPSRRRGCGDKRLLDSGARRFAAESTPPFPSIVMVRARADFGAREKGPRRARGSRGRSARPLPTSWASGVSSFMSSSLKRRVSSEIASGRNSAGSSGFPVSGIALAHRVPPMCNTVLHPG